MAEAEGGSRVRAEAGALSDRLVRLLTDQRTILSPTGFRLPRSTQQPR